MTSSVVVVVTGSLARGMDDLDGPGLGIRRRVHVLELCTRRWEEKSLRERKKKMLYVPRAPRRRVRRRRHNARLNGIAGTVARSFERWSSTPLPPPSLVAHLFSPCTRRRRNSVQNTIIIFTTIVC